MKNTFKLSVMGGLTVLLLIPCLAFVQSQEQKKTRHIRMTKIENGQKMEIDTVLTGDDVLVWNGDTIGPEKHIKKFSPSEFDKRHSPGMERRQKDVKIYRHRGGRNGEPFIMHGDSGESIQIITHDGDTTGQKIFIHKMRRNGDESDRFIHLHGPDGQHVPHAPGVPPVPHIRMFQGNQGGKGINLNDPNIISFKKKDIGGGREKIEIIRKKTKETENMDLNMEIDHLINVPQPPMAPEIDIEMEESDSQFMLKEKSESETKAAKKDKQEKAGKENK